MAVNSWKGSFLRRALLAMAGLAAVVPSESSAQIIVNGRILMPGDSSDAYGELAENVFLPADRTILQRLAQAHVLLEQDRYSEAVRYLGAILDAPEDYFFQPDKNEPVHRSLKAEAHRLIGQMPKKGRELYELQYGTRARQMLTEALATGNREFLAEVSRRYFHAEAGQEATLLLGLDHLDHGRPLAAALSLQRLQHSLPDADRFQPTLSLAMATCWLQAGMPRKAQTVLSALRKQRGNRPVLIAGREVSLFESDTGALPWLVSLIGSQRATGPDGPDQWAMFRGSPSRNATSEGGTPLLNLRWRIPMADGPLDEEHLRRIHRSSLEQGDAALPCLHPLAVGDMVLMRTAENLLAVDFVTGKRRWEVPVDDPLEAVAATTGDAANASGGHPAQRAAELEYRVFNDAVYGTISSDGQLVFSIEDLEPTGSRTSGTRRIIVGGRTQTVTPKVFNRLAAHDVRNGKLQWQLGGPADEFALREAEAFFLGPPLPLMGQLYALAEVKGEIRLLALNARTGDLLWSQQLAVVEQSILMDPMRRLAGVSPSYSDGILVCPTSAGAVVAVELATRSLLWGYRYRRPELSNRYRAMIAVPISTGTISQTTTRWSDATACIADGRVLVAPVESDSLHCLSLIDGKHLWEERRQEDLYVACIHQDKVVLVGRGGVRAVSLSGTEEKTETIEAYEMQGGAATMVKRDVTVVRPKPAWGGRIVELPEGVVPSGQGFRGGDQYFLPLSSAEVMSLDLVAGKSIHVSRSRKGSVPGNLVCYGGKVISQSFDGVELFYQLDAARQQVARRLADIPNDPVALSMQGEILMEQGKQAEAVAFLRRAYGLDADPRTRELLRDALLNGLRLDFATYHDHSEEIEDLLDDPMHWAAYLQLTATGLQQAGEWEAALAHYLKLVDLDSEYGRMQPTTGSLSVRRDRWIQARLAQLRDEADEAAKAIVDKAIEDRLREALERPNLLPLQRFLESFGNHPAADKARTALFLRLNNADQLLAAEMLLWPQQQLGDPTIAGPATARLADLLRRAGRPEDAAVCYRRLQREYADVECLDGKTGKRMLDAVPDGDEVVQILSRDAAWPAGKVELNTEVGARRQTANHGRYALAFEGTSSPFFSETTLRFDQARRTLLAYDALGRERWGVSLVDSGSPTSLLFNPSQTQAHVRGHLLLLSMGYQVMAIDTLGSGQPGEPKLLWKRDLTDATFGTGVSQAIGLAGIPIQVPIQPWGIQQFRAARYQAMRSGRLGPVTSRYVCFQRYRDLVAVDPLSGALLWVRHNIAPGDLLFGDDQFIFALANDGDEATVFRSLDGEMLGCRKVPHAGAAPASAPNSVPSYNAGAQRRYVAALGRNLLFWRTQGDQAVLELFDPWQQRELWPSRTFSAASKTSLVGQEAIGVFEPDGHFVLVSLTNGRTVAEAKLEAETNLAQVFVFRSGDQYVLVTNGALSLPADNQRMTQPLPGALYKPIGRGRVYLFDLAGKLLWPEAVEIENQHLLLNQPSRLPVLMFGCQVYDRSQSGSRRTQVSTLFLDKRTGRRVCSQDFPNMTSMCELTGDPQQNTVELTLMQHRLTMTFTDEPIPPALPADEQKEKEQQTDQQEKQQEGLGGKDEPAEEAATP
ncbi:MAG: PQQ-binding-like beta-propeller repeat protein [Pirellulales bacterium]|nr:PQQ-binding-like beta-propeller repeat protein [Pirellulales bacterium]